MTQRHIATEQRSFAEILESYPHSQRWAGTLLSRLRGVTVIPDRARILDIGAAAGEFVAACCQLGHRCEGVEPWDAARLNAAKLSAYLGIAPLQIVDGTVKSIPYAGDTFDIIFCNTVLEHVVDVEEAFAEICRVLRTGGVFYFSSTSSLCPMQNEIRGFPLFGWYPDPLKRRIMNWAKSARPELVGYSHTPALNWFTPRKARRLLRRHGFTRVYDRWDLKGLDEGGPIFKLALRAIRSTKFSKILADILIPDCAYAAIK